MLQWVSGMNAAQRTTILRTFQSVFPETTLWEGGLAVGTKRPLQLSRGAFERAMQDPSIRAALAAEGIADFDSLLALYRAGPDELRSAVGPGPILTDDRPLVEYFLSLPHDGSATDLDAVRGDPTRIAAP
jgi:hypothetical protein